MIYALKGRGNQHAYDAFGFHVERQIMNFSDILNGRQALVNASTGLDAIPGSIVAEDVYQIFNLKAGFMTFLAGFSIINKDPADFAAGSLYLIGVEGSVIISPSGVGDDPAFFGALDPSLGNLVYPTFSGENGGYAASSMNGYLAIDDSVITFTPGTLGEGGENDLDDAVLEFYMFGAQMMDRENAYATAELVAPVVLN